jgi:hypothetical protein
MASTSHSGCCKLRVSIASPRRRTNADEAQELPPLLAYRPVAPPWPVSFQPRPFASAGPGMNWFDYLLIAFMVLATIAAVTFFGALVDF